MTPRPGAASCATPVPGSTEPGARPVVVLLGGHLCTPALWAHTCTALEDRAECRPLTLEGGASMGELAEAVLRRAPPRFSLVGLSMGGHVALEIMRRAPSRVDRLALVDTTADVDTPQRRALRERDEVLVREQGFEALARVLPDRWLSPRCAADPALRALVLEMVLAAGNALRDWLDWRGA